MRRILRADFSYNKTGFSVLFSLCILFFLIDLFWGGFSIPIGENGRISFGLDSELTGLHEIYNLVVNTAIAWFIAIVVMGASADKQKLDRFNGMLPLPRRIYGIGRLLFVNASQMAIFVLWLLFLAISSNEFEMTELWAIFSANAVLLSLVTIFIIHHDFGFFENPKYKRLNYVLLFLLIIATNVIFNVEYFSAVPMNIVRFFISLPGALFFTFFWIGLSLLSVTVYSRRRIYLE